MNIRNCVLSFSGYCLLVLPFLMVITPALAQEQADPVNVSKSNRWVSSTKVYYQNSLRLTVHDGKDLHFLTEGHRDHKPVWSKTGDMVTFFRATGETDLKQTWDKGTDLFNLFGGASVLHQCCLIVTPRAKAEEI